MEIVFNIAGPPLHIMNVYAPQGWDSFPVRSDFFKNLENFQMESPEAIFFYGSVTGTQDFMAGSKGKITTWDHMCLVEDTVL